jgi:hypothetical protein
VYKKIKKLYLGFYENCCAWYLLYVVKIKIKIKIQDPDMATIITTIEKVAVIQSWMV